MRSQFPSVVSLGGDGIQTPVKSPCLLHSVNYKNRRIGNREKGGYDQTKEIKEYYITYSSGSKEQRAAPGLTCGSNFSLLSKKCIHSACLGPKTLVITGLKWGPLRRNMRAAHLSQALPTPLPPNPLWIPGFCPRDEPGWAFPGSSWSELAEWHLPGPFHTLVLLPFASCQSSPLSSVMLHGVLCLS